MAIMHRGEAKYDYAWKRVCLKTSMFMFRKDRAMFRKECCLEKALFACLEKSVFACLEKSMFGKEHVWKQACLEVTVLGKSTVVAMVIVMLCVITVVCFS
jgi:hypothetical protein